MAPLIDNPPPPAGSSDGDGPQKPVKRMRASKSKTKNGCRNCKQRRIKCDEKRPSCTQCVRSKKICTGYPPPARARPHVIAPKPLAAAGPSSNRIVQPIPLPPRRPPKSQSQAQAHAKAQAQAQVQTQPFAPPQDQRQPTPPQTPKLEAGSVILLQHPTPSISFDIQEGQYFQLFCSNTANELSGYFDNVFWTKTVLQECHTELAIKHAVVALGALYKTLEKSTESPPGSPSDDVSPSQTTFRHWEVAVRQYSKACHALLFANSQDQRSHRTRLMASVLLACFDSFVGDHRQAIKQIQTGLGLLEKLREERRRSFTPRPEEPVEDELIQMFTRLAIQAKSYDMAFHFPEPYVIHLLPPKSDSNTPSDAGSPVSTHQEPIPERFASLREARIAWDTLCEQVFRAMESMFQHASSIPNILPQSMMVYGRATAARFQDWSNAFDHILGSRNAPGINSQEKAGIAVLKMNQIMGQVLYLMTFSDSEMQFDSFQKHFQAIVELASEVVGDEERRAAEKRCPDQRSCEHHHGQSPDIFGGYEYAAHHIKASFSADLGIVPPLYVVATKSRHPVIRRQAIQLLRSSARREGMWDSGLTAQIGAWVMKIEEDDEEQVPTPGDSPAAGPPPSSYSPLSRPSTAGHQSSSSQASGSGTGIDFGELPLGPGGNARFNPERNSVSSSIFSALMQKQPVPAEKRVLLKSAEFDLREHTAVVRCGTRGLTPGSFDSKLRETLIRW